MAQRPKPSPGQAVLEVNEGEAIYGGWITPHIAGTGHYKLIAKKRRDGKIEWAHFIQRDDGRKEVAMRGTAEDDAQMQLVLDLANKNLSRTFGPHIALRTSFMEARTLDGQKISYTKH